MKWIIILVTLCAGCIANAQEVEVERYKNLQSSAIFDPTASDESVNQLLHQGLASQDPVIFRLALQTINTYVEHHIEERPGPTGSLPVRPITDVPGLKETLIKHWRSKHAEHGHNVSEFILDQIRTNVGGSIDLRALQEAHSAPDQLGKALSEAIGQQLREQYPWIEIPQSLCVLWPQDETVHTLVWEYHENDRDEDPHRLLRLLNLGEFVTTAANDYRMSQLVAYPYRTGRISDEAVSLAAKGLALSHPEEAIPNLIQAGLDHIKPRSDVLITLAGYEDSQLDVQYDRLVSLVSGASRSLPLDETYLRALNRLVPYVMRPLSPPIFSQTAQESLASADHLQRFGYLREQGVYNPEISDKTVVAMVSEGINHRDANVVELTLHTLIEYSGALAVTASLGVPDLHPHRPIHQVPNLRTTLINGFQIGQIQSGSSVNSDDQESITTDDPSSHPINPLENIPDLESLRFGLLQILCRFWPNDPAVHALVWQYQSAEPSVRPLAMLRLLNTGRFTTKRADNYRISQLEAYTNNSGPEDDIVTTMAARSLALNHPDVAIPLLIATGTEHKESREAVLITLSGYEESQLEPYYESLAPLVNIPRNSLPFNQEIQAALDQLTTIMIK